MAHQLDCLILGGGIAGLWTLRVLLAEGYDAALVETAALGTGQTIASQGIIHAGTKYALTGHAAEAAKAANAAAAIWIECLRGRDLPGSLPDLSPTKILSPYNYLFTTPGPASRLTALAASKALATKPNKLDPADFPSAFCGAPSGVDVYKLEEPVLDIPSLLGTLADPVRNCLIFASKVDLSWGRQTPECTRGVMVHITTQQGQHTIAPRALVCTAGAGNEALLAQLDLAVEIPMQRRPLHMVVARHTQHSGTQPLPVLNAHCVSMSDKPRMTFTTVGGADGPVWLIGGNISETGIDRTPAQQIAETCAEIAKILPWLDLSALEFTTFRVDRAEGANPQAKRPDTPVVQRHESVIACWPTKLVLAPLATDEIRTHLKALGITPSSSAAFPSADLPFATFSLGLASPPWDREDIPWT